MSRRLVDKIRANDFADLPPAKGKSRPISQAGEGHVVVVQAEDLMQSRKIIPDLATWLQCFSLYVALLTTQQPERIPELMAYQSIIAKASMKYKWSSWIVYDQNFRQDVAGNPTQWWAKVDPSIYAVCFTSQAISSENWCSCCQCLDHTTGSCPFCPRKRPRSGILSSPQGRMDLNRADQQICIKFNRFDGDCTFGKHCRFIHSCSNCRGQHPMSRCTAGSKPSEPPVS